MRLDGEFARTAVHQRTRVVLLCVIALVAATLAAATPASAATAWTVRTVPDAAVSQPHAAFAAVSCPRPKFCMAVGRRVGLDGQLGTLAETWNGRRWRIASESVPGTAVRSFEAVSCLSPTFCVALAQGLLDRAVRWDGHRWSNMSLQHPRGISLDGLQCRSSTNCTLVGSLGARAAAWHWTGRTWALKSVPSPKSASLAAVSCPSASICYAVGTYASSPGHQLPLARRWDGRRWTRVSVPSTAGSLADVSCARTTRCTAVGAGGADGSHALIADLSGGQWRYNTIRGADYPNGVAVSCTLAGTCTALVSHFDAAEAVVTSIAVRTGSGSFHRSRAAYRDLADLTCSGSGCTIVGSSLINDRSGFSIADNPTSAVAFQRHGAGLTRQTVPQPAGGTDNLLSAVSCATGGFCAAVAGPLNTGAIYLRSRARGAWHTVPNTQRGEWADVSCSSAAFCMAVGQGTSRSWDGTDWTAHSIPEPDGASNHDAVLSVACVSPTWCEAVGTTGQPGNALDAFAVHWDGSSWAVRTIPTPAGSDPIAELDAVSCVSTSACLAVGSGQRPLVERWNGTSWTLVSTAGLPAAAEPTAVSCWTASGCMVAASGENGPALTASWNGTRFTRTTLVGSSPAAFGMSCASATSCTAAGIHAVSGEFQPLIQRWDGTAWHGVALPHVSGYQSEFGDVSCVTARCTAVGDVGREYDVALAADSTS